MEMLEYRSIEWPSPRDRNQRNIPVERVESLMMLSGDMSLNLMTSLYGVHQC
jgi:hypothetical protein